MTEYDEKLCRGAFHLGPEGCAKIKTSYMNRIAADIKKIKEQKQLEITVKLEEERRINTELANKPNISREVVRQNLVGGICAFIVLAFSSSGEFIFALWTVSAFNLGQIESLLVAATIVIISLKGIDLYLTFLRNQYPHLTNIIFLILSCIGVVLVFLLIFFAAEIRQALQGMSYTGLSTSTAALEDTVQKADEFHSQNTEGFIWLMVTLTMAFTIIGGTSFHIANSRIKVSMPYYRLYRRLRNVITERQRAAEVISAQDSRLTQFIADFDTDVMKEEIKTKNEKLKQELKAQKKQNSPSRKRLDFIQFFAFPLVLIILALIIFFLLRGEAKAEEMHIVFLDTSGSLSVKDYTGKETEFEKNVKAIEYFIRNNIASGDELKVIAITESSFSRPHILLDTQVSPKKGVFGEELARQKVRLLKAYKKLGLKKATARSTDIFGAINLAAIYFSKKAHRKNLIFFSDMRQCAHKYNLENYDKIDAKGMFTAVERDGLIPDLAGVHVRCLGVHGAGKTPVYWLSLKEFWTLYFNRAKAKTLAFTMERRFHNE